MKKLIALLALLLSFNVFAFTKMPGSARDVGDGWVIGTDAGSTGFGIYRWYGKQFNKVSGSAVRIGGTYATPWVVNNLNQIFRWTGSTWQRMPGSARDVADGWVIGINEKPGGFGIFRWNGSAWKEMPGSAVRIGGNYQNPWVVNDQSQIFRWTGTQWQLMPGTAFDAGDGWVIGTAPEFGGFGIYRWNGSQFVKIPGAAVGVGNAGGPPWVVNDAGEIFRW
jgi:hypothetical protein